MLRRSKSLVIEGESQKMRPHIDIEKIGKRKSVELSNLLKDRNKEIESALSTLLTSTFASSDFDTLLSKYKIKQKYG